MSMLAHDSRRRWDQNKLTSHGRNLLKGESIPYPRGSAEWITEKCGLPDPTTTSGTLSRGKQITVLQFWAHTNTQCCFQDKTMSFCSNSTGILGFSSKLWKFPMNHHQLSLLFCSGNRSLAGNPGIWCQLNGIRRIPLSWPNSVKLAPDSVKLPQKWSNIRFYDTKSTVTIAKQIMNRL